MRLPFSVQVFVIAKHGSTWSVLLLQRNPRPELSLPDFWQGVSGALEPGESFEAAAIREVWEETSIRLQSVNSACFEHVYPIKAEWRNSYGPEPTHVQEKVFYGVIPEMRIPKLSDEHKAFGWCVQSEALSLLTFANNAQCVQAVFKALSERAA
ncbi:MAG: NUDIX domain-containing protein [Rhodocyclaceae bacterium]|jgi:dATP pyrophosphohydrolase|nr:NUDIX domain-containing protein [Rhodocyclaceae bacterium]MCE2724886.1 NUDIX domain-containing protein [Betaproteobacteria bacterium]MCA3018015.1 NUDIX domain-containing protein [Rhodocyclaceae bacterium]MCA3021241.1 NUDIX domain-containing protein [Rhodocyclaceae bacterium]MCA3026065.1 NUDIX domain-containing protein [Rhodocyclaceae bacterium]